MHKTKGINTRPAISVETRKGKKYLDTFGTRVKRDVKISFLGPFLETDAGGGGRAQVYCDAGCKNVSEARKFPR